MHRAHGSLGGLLMQARGMQLWMDSKHPVGREKRLHVVAHSRLPSPRHPLTLANGAMAPGTS
jgi:hypothetical protein